jgi:hypothetical protein
MYPWGYDPNNNFKMYWKDAANVLQDLEQFQALYVEVHGCVWSECGVDNFDDDGENHDGDENWYETRTRTFCANAAYSLYGIRKNNFKLLHTCSKGTYINSFFTYGGADVLAKALDLSISNKDGNRYTPPIDYDDAYGYGSSSSTSNSDCVAVDSNYGRQLQQLPHQDRRLSGSEDSGDDFVDYDGTDTSPQTVATTMGCAASATSKFDKFVLAGFSDTSCMGRNFVETLDTYTNYNKAMRKVSCTRIWDLGSYNRQNKNNNNNNDDDGNNNNNNDDLYNAADDDANNRELNENDNNQGYTRIYHSVAEELLYQSWACDLSLYPEQCPDPYGLKRKYFNVLKAAKNGQPIQLAVWNARLRKPIQILTWFLFVVGAYLAIFAYSIRNRSYIRSKGGGIRGFAAVVWRDVVAAAVALGDAIQKAKERQMEKRAKRSSSKRDKSGSGSSSKDTGMWGFLFGKSKKKKKKKRKSKEKSLRRTPSGREVDPEKFHDEEGSVYTELTDDHTPSQKSRGSSRYTSANYSSSRTSKAAEAAFAAAAQFDLEQQQQAGSAVSPNRHHHPSILPSASNASSNNKRSRSAGKSRPRGRSRSPSGASTRSRSLPRRTVDPSPQRSPGGTRIGRSHPQPQRSRSPQHRIV